MAATLDGIPVFGAAVKIKHQPSANAAQISAFFGIEGSQYLGGGSRGRTFFVEGVMIADTPGDVELLGVSLDIFADNNVHVLTNTVGNTWINIVYNKEFEWTSDKYMTTLGGTAWCRPYKMVLNGLS